MNFALVIFRQQSGMLFVVFHQSQRDEKPTLKRYDLKQIIIM